MATLVLFRPPPGPTIITVHDILPYMTRDDRTVSSYYHIFDRLFDAIAMWGVRRTETLLAVSEYTKRCLVDHFGVEPGRITVTLEGVKMTFTSGAQGVAALEEQMLV
jgi:hypothetical protein